jgi:hypothetical protein
MKNLVWYLSVNGTPVGMASDLERFEQTLDTVELALCALLPQTWQTPVVISAHSYGATITNVYQGHFYLQALPEGNDRPASLTNADAAFATTVIRRIDRCHSAHNTD